MDAEGSPQRYVLWLCTPKGRWRQERGPTYDRAALVAEGERALAGRNGGPFTAAHVLPQGIKPR